MLKQFSRTSFTGTRSADHCFQCGFEMLRVEMTFALLGNEVAWNIFLPVCPRCDSNSDGQDYLATYTTYLQTVEMGSYA